MTSQQAEFDAAGRVVWDEAATRPPDLTRGQAAMFKDRPDLWPIHRRAAHRRVKTGAGQLSFESSTKGGEQAMANEKPQKYMIVRFYEKSGRRKITRRGLSLADAQMWCQRPDTHGKGWFDGFTTDRPRY